MHSMSGKSGAWEEAVESSAAAALRTISARRPAHSASPAPLVCTMSAGLTASAGMCSVADCVASFTTQLPSFRYAGDVAGPEPEPGAEAGDAVKCFAGPHHTSPLPPMDTMMCLPDTALPAPAAPPPVTGDPEAVGFNAAADLADALS
jgi:hypothetical protein